MGDTQDVRRLSRRALLRQAGSAAGALALSGCLPSASAPSPAPSASASALASPTAAPSPAPTAAPAASDVPTAKHLPRWHGFNIEWGAPYRDRPIPYDEWDFDFMAEHGFTFARLPVDYRKWTPAPLAFDPAGLKEPDRAIRFARDRRIHANLDLHSAPGYTDYTRPRVTTLWEDGAAGDEMRRRFADIWGHVAAYYKGTPSAELSFNLINEPPDIAASAYVRVVEPVVAAIRAADPDRLIIADGLEWGVKPVPELARFGVAQATRGYQPLRLTHYHASWMEGSDRWPLPTWPLQPAPNAFIVGPYQKDFQSPLVLRGDFAAGAEVRILIEKVSHGVDLRVRADGAEILRRQFVLGPGTGEWKESTYRPQYSDYEATYERAYSATLPRAAREITIDILDGDWIRFSTISVGPLASGKTALLQAGSDAWGVRQSTYAVDPSGTVTSTSGHATDKDDLWHDDIAPWKQLEATGVGVHVGEWGAHNQTPHDVVLKWMADQLANFRRAGWGWALWELRGSFGCVDSERRDVAYESYKGHKLDRAMLDLLQAG